MYLEVIKVAILFLASGCLASYDNTDLVIFTVSTDDNDGFQRFMRSARIFEYEVKVLGSESQWTGGDVSRYPGGGQKIKLLKEAMVPYENDGSTIVLFLDSYDVVFLNTKQELLRKYNQMKSKLIFSAEKFCWPDASLKSKYPVVEDGESRFLNSGAFIGPASSVFEIINMRTVGDSDDDQLYYTTIFLDENLRGKYNISLDTRSELFQNLNGALDDIKVEFDDETGYLVNTLSDSRPIVAHGNGPIKVKFNSLTNYLAKSWSPEQGCNHCGEDHIDLENIPEDSYPIVQISAFITGLTPFIEGFFETLHALDYPKKRIYLTIYCNVEEHLSNLLTYNSTHGWEYRSSVILDANKFPSEITAKTEAWKICLAYEDCTFSLTLDSSVRLTNKNTLKHLVRMNRNTLAPLVSRPHKFWSNFWGDLNPEGFYARSDDYMDIVSWNKTGIWNVPFVGSVYLYSRWAVRQVVNNLATETPFVDLDIAEVARSKNIFLMVDNQYYFGHLINMDSSSNEHLHSDIWQLDDNPEEWEQRYIHPDYFKYLNASVDKFEQPCPDVFWFPLLSERFCREMIEELEHFNQWSGGTNIDARLEGGYENVPTIDTHMRQIGWEDQWIKVLQTYVFPIQKIVFAGYTELPSARMNFVVRYRPDEQPYLRPHHDASTYTLNIALNRRDSDYKGGGSNFLRYNCSVTDTRVGWSMAHPGRVTHIHEGLKTTFGTRYILVTFVNPLPA